MIWRFEPIYKPTPWGGKRLRSYKAGSRHAAYAGTDDTPIGESWELSALPGAESVVTDGPDHGQTLPELIKRYGPALLGQHVYRECGDRFPLLFKFIHAEADLSVQVHPSDDVAHAMGLPCGKNEMWVVIEAAPGAVLYNGFSTPINPAELKELSDTGGIMSRIRRIEVVPDDAFYIPAGRIHSIGAGILLAEIQQASTDTFRIYDYNRPGLDGKPRQLHIDKAQVALDCNDVTGSRLPQPADGSPLLESTHFTVNHLSVSTPTERHPASHDSFAVYMVLHGDITVLHGSETVTLPQGSTILVSADTETITLLPHTAPASLLEIYH